MAFAPARGRFPGCGLLLLTALGAAALWSAPAAGAVRHPDLTYLSPGNLTRNRFDLYLHNAGVVPGMPTIIDLHGGGYTAGDKAQDYQLSSHLADQGYAVCSMNYTLAATDGTRSSFPQTLRDVRAMIRWVRTDGVELGLSPTIIIIGQSAGATIGLAAAYAPESPEFTPALPDPPGGYGVQATVGLFGRYDLVWDAQTYGSPYSVINYLAGPITAPGQPDRYAAAAARTHVQPCSPPTRLIVGDLDAVVPPGNSYRLAAALGAAGVPSHLQIVFGAGHGTQQLGSPSFMAAAVGGAIPGLLGSARAECVTPPPANDRCADATPIFAEQSMVASSIGALTDAASPCGRLDTRDVWFSFVPPASRRYTLDTLGTTGVFDSSLTVYDSCAAGATVLGCNDNAEGSPHARVSLPLAAGRAVYIRLAGAAGSAGEIRLNLDAGEPTAPPPLNDHCPDSAALPLGLTLGTTVAATGGSISPCGASDLYDVWFHFDAPAEGSYRFETFGSLGLTDTTLALYADCTGGAALGCNDDADAGTGLSRVQATLGAGQRVLVRVAGGDLSEGSFVISVSGAATTQGACCQGTVCQVVDGSGACAGSFRGVGVACGSAGNPVACCRANFNQADGLTVQDLFDFLYSYFTLQPAADFNGGGSVTVQDVFDFLGAYFTGCG